MKLKTLLLSSGAVFMVAGGAQAADLSIAEPVEYVLVCSAFGDNFWYIPGTQTCIKIGGEVKFSVKWTAFTAETTYGHSSNWKFVTDASVNFMASSMTDHGRLDGYVKIGGTFDDPKRNYEVYYDTDGSSTSGLAYIKEAWLKLGHVKMGNFGSPQNVDFAYSPGAWVPDHSANLIQLEWAAAGFGVYLGIEDPRDWGTALPVFYSTPDITGAIELKQDHFKARVTAGWAQLDSMSVHGIAGALEVAMDPLSVAVGGAVGSAGKFTGLSYANGTQAWTAYISGKWQATSAVSLAATWAYATDNVDPMTKAGAKLVWAPYAGFEAGIEGSAWKSSTMLQHDGSVTAYAKRTW